MIARQWRCLCPKDHCTGFLAHLRETGIAESSALPGFLGHLILTREPGEMVELTLITYWESLSDIEAFAGKDISRARLYPRDQAFGIEPDLEVKHYTVIETTLTP